MSRTFSPQSSHQAASLSPAGPPPSKSRKLKSTLRLRPPRRKRFSPARLRRANITYGSEATTSRNPAHGYGSRTTGQNRPTEAQRGCHAIQGEKEKPGCGYRAIGCDVSQESDCIDLSFSPRSFPKAFEKFCIYLTIQILCFVDIVPRVVVLSNIVICNSSIV